MALPNDSINITPGSGKVVATHLISNKEYQVIMQADLSGHLLGSKPVYFYNIPSQVHVNTANTIHWDLFNASTLIVRVLSILQIPDFVTAVTGVAKNWKINRTSAVGTNGTPLTALLADTTQDALNENITARSKPTGGATESLILRNYILHSEETNAGAQQFSMLSTGGVCDLIPACLRPPLSIQGIVLRQNQGLSCVQITASAAGNTGWFICFTVE